ncbi:hypothetical protein [Candidatus Poriferisocius sp.]|uniref:hypothetical protein n=1 Tax=Candidatus Poriferisocius sp. TaxID=3101276 RepID=UPI003B5A01D7
MAKSSTTPRGSSPPNQVAAELKELLVAYARQEIVTPLTNLGATLKLGILGALSIGVGLVFLVIAGLRLLQEEASGVFDGNMSALPYVAVLLGLLVVLAGLVAVKGRTSRGGGREPSGTGTTDDQ